MNKSARLLSFADDIGDEDSEGEAVKVPVKRMRQAPPPAHIFVHEKPHAAPAGGMYSRDHLDALKASQKFTAPKAVESIVEVVEEVILSGEAAERLAEMAEEEAEAVSLAVPPAAGVGDWEDKQLLDAGRRATKDLLKGKDKDRLFVSAKAAERTTVIDMNGDSDLRWEDEIIQRGVFSSKTDIRTSSGVFTASRRPTAPSAAASAPEVDILDIINNIQTMADKSAAAVAGYERKLSELAVQQRLLASSRAAKQTSVERVSEKLTVIQSAKAFLGNVIFMWREKLPGLTELRDESVVEMGKYVSSRWLDWQRWQEDRLMLVKAAEELVGIEDYEPVAALSGEEEMEVDVYGRTVMPWRMTAAHLCRDLLSALHPDQQIEAKKHISADRFEELYRAHDMQLISTAFTAMAVAADAYKSWQTSVTNRCASKDALMADVAPDMLSVGNILNEFRSVRKALSAAEYQAAFVPLSLFQVAEAIAMLDLAGTWQPFSYSQVERTAAWVEELGSYAEGLAAPSAEEDELTDGDVLPQLVMAVALPWLEHGLTLIDLLSSASCRHCLSTANGYLQLLHRHEDHRIKFAAQLGAVVFNVLEGTLRFTCVPVCKTVPTERMDQGRGGHGGWQGIGKAVMAFQLVAVTMLWQNALLFKDYLLTSPSQVKELVWGCIGRKCQQAMLKMLKSADQHCVRVVVDLLSVSLQWLELLQADNSLHYKLVKAGVQGMQADSSAAAALASLVTAVERIRQ